jgi:hypothetical protein
VSPSSTPTASPTFILPTIPFPTSFLP